MMYFNYASSPDSIMTFEPEIYKQIKKSRYVNKHKLYFYLCSKGFFAVMNPRKLRFI